eukprot:4900544-Prymnesium_polylepis.1
MNVVLAGQTYFQLENAPNSTVCRTRQSNWTAARARAAFRHFEKTGFVRLFSALDARSAERTTEPDPDGRL